MAKKIKKQKITTVVTAQKAKTPKLLWLILALGLAIKLIYLKYSQTSPFYEPMLLDPKYYHEWAVRLVKGQWDTGVFYGLPLYPYFLALCYKISGFSILFVKMAQIVLGTVTLFLIFKTGERLHSPGVGLLAAGLAACYGPLFFHEQIFIAEAIGLPLYALTFLLTLNFVEKDTWKNAAFLGAAAGLATLTKAGVLLFVAGLILVLAVKALRQNKKVLPVLACALIYAGTILPVTLHNWVRGNDFVLLTSHAGFNFYIGNNPKAEGVFKAPEGTGSNVEAQIEDSRALAERSAGSPLRASEISRYWSDKAWNFISQDPGRFLILSARKLILFFDRREISDVDDYQFAGRLNDFLKLPWLNFSFLAPFLFAGLVSLWSCRKHRALTLAWIGAYLLGMMSFFVSARYRLPLLPVFFVLAGMGLADIYESLKSARIKKSAIFLIALAAGALICRAELVGTDWARDYVNAGDALLEKNDFEGAKEFYRQALEVNPSHAKANLAMGLVLTKQGMEGAGAGDFYRKATEADPNNVQALNNLGLWCFRQGKASEAEKYFLRAIEIKPGHAQAHNNLGMVYGQRGDNDAALREFETSLKINPNSARANTNLGLILYRKGRIDEAKKRWERALEIDPEFAEAKKALLLLR